jgi:1-acyl-sn-glycerol-3-phosphate acyltransferase
MTVGGFGGMTKAQLLDLARDARILGRSRMSKQELIDALENAESARHGRARSGDRPASATPPPISIPGISSEDRAEARHRRARLQDRLRAYVDKDEHCPWRSIEGHPCGLPVVRGTDRCGLHGDGRIADVAFPLTGELGFAAWPTLWRHLTLATYDVDAFGLDPVVAEMAWHTLNGLFYDYFRVEVDGIEHVRTEGPSVLVANHGGAALPYDAAMMSLAVMNEAAVPRRVRVVGTEIFNMLPVVSHLYRKVGAAYAARDDAREILRRGHVLGVFPEGERGFMKPVWEAYRVGRLGRGGFVEIAEEAGAPIVPVAIVGSEEVHPAITTSKLLARLVRLIFPEQRVEEIAIALNPVPLPIRWRIRFLPPILPSERSGGLDALDQLERSEDVRRAIQDALDDILATRRTAF